MISKRAQSVDSSGIRKVFDLAAKLKDPINLSIGQPNFPAFPQVKELAIKAVMENKSSYTPTQGNNELCARIANENKITNPDTKVFLTSGVSAGLFLAYTVLLDPGEEILIPDPFFCIYRDLATLLNAKPVYYDTYPDFVPKVQNIEHLVTPKTKAILINSPSNPTGYALSNSELSELVEFARKKDLVIIYDEIYSSFAFDQPHVTPLGNYEKLIVLNGFSKSAGVPGWRMGYVIAPDIIAREMLKIQQYTFVCANSIGQFSLSACFDFDFSPILSDYKKKRDLIVQGLSGKYEFVKPGGAFYIFPVAPGGDATKFVAKCVEHNLLVVPGNVFSRKDTNFRISFSASEQQLEKGIEVLRNLA